MNAGSLVPALLAILISGAAAPAQSLDYLYGRVLDPSGAVVPEAGVTVVNEDSGFRRATQTGPDGAYLIGSLQPGVYKITVRKEGFRTMIRFNVKVANLQPARADFARCSSISWRVLTSAPCDCGKALNLRSSAAFPERFFTRRWAMWTPTSCIANSSVFAPRRGAVLHMLHA